MTAILLALAIGFCAGLRTFTPFAAVRFPYRDWTSILAIVLALFELVADKVPQTPSRLMPGPLIVRAFFGGYCAWSVTERFGTPTAVAIVTGVIGAMIGAYVGNRWRVRMAPSLRIPPLASALIEDAVAIVGSFWIVLGR